MTAVDTRTCHLYRFYVRHPITGQRARGYIGETARMPFERLMEHVYAQPWADTILGWEVDPAVFYGKDAVLAAEQAAVEDELPLYNVEYNLDNPYRIKPWEAAAQRRLREPGWNPPTVRPPRQRAARQPAKPKVKPKRRRRQVPKMRMPWRLILWLVLAVGFGTWSIVTADVTVTDGIVVGVGGSSVISGWLWYALRPRRGK